MAGHSKWNNIKRKKGAVDAVRNKVFTKIAREISVAVKEGGSDPEMNSKLRDAIAKAKQNNVPNDNVERAIKKAAGDTGKNNYENIIYEGYGPDGVAVIVLTLTDNKNRSASDVRHAFDKFGAGLGTSGSVSYLFEDKGIIVLDAEGLSEEKLLEDVLEAEADDFLIAGDICEVYTSPAKTQFARDFFEKSDYKLLSAENAKIPSTTVKLLHEDSVLKMTNLIDMLEESDDVIDIWHNWEYDE